MDGFSCIPPPFPNAPAPEDDLEKKETAGSCEDTKSVMSDDSTMNDDLADLVSPAERLAGALSCKDEATRLLKENDVAGARDLYRAGLNKISPPNEEAPFSCDGDADLEGRVEAAKLALNLNLSLCHIKLSEWIDAVRAASAALILDKKNVKALFRRGLARSRLGFLEEARADLLQVCQLDKANADARKELVNLKELLAAAKAVDKKNFGGLFGKAAGLYDDRAQEVEREKRKQAEKLQQDMREFESENKKLEAEGKPAVESFDEWKRLRDEATKKAEDVKRQSTQKSSRTCSSVAAAEMDEEDKKIVDETKKMGYCYFNRQLPEEEKKLLEASKRVPVKLEANREEENVAGKSISTWNSAGTTYEEKDCSSWVRNRVKDLLAELNVSYGGDGGESAKRPRTDGDGAAPSGMSYSIKVSSVDSVEGDSQVMVLRGTKRYLYDLTVAMSWNCEIDIDGKTPCEINGKLRLADVSSASSTREASDQADAFPDWLADGVVSYTTSVAESHRPAIMEALTALKRQLLLKFRTLDEDFKAFA